MVAAIEKLHSNSNCMAYIIILLILDFFLIQPALHCTEYPVLSYVLKLRLEKSQHVIERFVSANKSRVLLTAQDGLKRNKKYVYTVSATNIVGNTSTPLGTTYCCKS